MNGGFYSCKRRTTSFGAYKENYPKYRFQFNGKNNLILFEKEIGFVNPRYQKRLDSFLIYSQEYDEIIRGISPRNVKNATLERNATFIKDMAVPRIELGISAL